MGVIGSDEYFAFVGDETFADALAIIASNGDVFEIRVNTGKAASGSNVLSVLKRTSESWIGELILKDWPASLKMACSSSVVSAVNSL